MKMLLLSFLFLMMYATAISQEDGYLSEAGTNRSELLRQNKITRELILKYTFCKDLKGISLFSDLSKIILADSVTVYYDEYGLTLKRIRDIKKSPSILIDYGLFQKRIRDTSYYPSTLVDTFYYDSSYRLSEVSTSTFRNSVESEIGYTLYTYTGHNKIDQSNTIYLLSNGLKKNGAVKNKYNDYNQLIEVWKESNLSKLVLTERYFYKHGRVYRIYHYNDDYYTEFHYKWRSIHVYSYNENEYFHKTIFRFNRHNQCKRKIHGNTVESYTYNKDGTIAESRVSYEGNMVSITQHHYFTDPN